MKFIKDWWFIALLVTIGFATFKFAGSFGADIHSKKCEIESDRPSCYIFYGIAQNDIPKNGGELKVNYLIENFPERPHTVFVEIINPKGELDFLYSDKHAASHKAHLCVGRCQRQYKATYHIPKLEAGKYKLRVTFKFDYAIGTKDLSSNDISFEVK